VRKSTDKIQERGKVKTKKPYHTFKTIQNLNTDITMIYFVNGKAKFAFGDKSLNNNAKQVIDNLKCKETGKRLAA
jgi:hypothetical protein